MVNNHLLLSICIPTYNRCEYLDKTIASIVSDPSFVGGQVELIISDNCSTDDTPAVVMKYKEQYDNIIYHRNKENIYDANYIKVLSLSRGDFLKLYNDTAMFLENTITFLLSAIKQNIDKKPVLCFPNAELPHTSIIKKQCSSFQEFVDMVSYYSTWIGTFGIWREEFSQYENDDKSLALRFWHVDILFQMVAKKKDVWVYNQKLIQIQEVQKKGGYNIFEVFADNYLSLYKEYLIDGQLSKGAFRKEKRRLFRYFFLGWMKKISVDKNRIYNFDVKEGVKILHKQYKSDLIFYFGLTYLWIYKIAQSFRVPKAK